VRNSGRPRPQGSKIHHFISIVTYGGAFIFLFDDTYQWAQYAKVLDYNRLERLARIKISSLLGPLVIYEENQIL